jgi:hypothetical protein
MLRQPELTPEASAGELGELGEGEKGREGEKRRKGEKEKRRICPDISPNSR